MRNGVSVALQQALFCLCFIEAPVLLVDAVLSNAILYRLKLSCSYITAGVKYLSY